MRISDWSSDVCSSDLAEIHAPGLIAADDPNLLGMRDTLIWLDREVAPYPGKTLRLLAAPGIGSTGFAVPQAMLTSPRGDCKRVGSGKSVAVSINLGGRRIHNKNKIILKKKTNL